MVDLTPLTGLIGTAQLKVGAEHTAPFVGSGSIAVLATPVTGFADRSFDWRYEPPRFF
jgi:hypothetical protein